MRQVKEKEKKNTRIFLNTHGLSYPKATNVSSFSLK